MVLRCYSSKRISQELSALLPASYTYRHRTKNLLTYKYRLYIAKNKRKMILMVEMLDQRF